MKVCASPCTVCERKEACDRDGGICNAWRRWFHFCWSLLHRERKDTILRYFSPDEQAAMGREKSGAERKPTPPAADTPDGMIERADWLWTRWRGEYQDEFGVLMSKLIARTKKNGHQFAGAVGVSYVSVYKYMRGAQRPTPQNWEKIKEYLYHFAWKESGT